MAVSISNLFFEHHRHSLGIGETAPRISWRFEGDAQDWQQSGYDLEVFRDPSQEPQLYEVTSSESLFVPWPEHPLESKENARVRARAHGQEGQSSTPWSDWVSVEIGLLSPDDWAGAVPIAADHDFDITKAKPPVYFRKSFQVGANSSAVQSARLYITAMGLYEAEINGKRVGDCVMAPGWQSYGSRHVYNTYDVTDLVENGENAIGVVVGEGWYSGRFFPNNAPNDRNYYGSALGQIAMLVISLEDGETIKIPSDLSWSASTGPIVDSQIYDGEYYDSRREAEIENWTTASFDDADWYGVKELPSVVEVLVSPDAPPVRKIEEIRFQHILKSPSGKTILDFGQNFVGWLKIKVTGPAGTNITLSHAEILQNGELHTEALRTAKATDHFVLHGQGEQTWEPKFTFRGFRYAQLDNWPESETPLTMDAVIGTVVHSDMEQTGWFKCSNSLLNQFHSNVRWSMKGNFLSIPTDCPQRDERAGWTGDAHAFGPTSNFLYDTAGFWRSWHKDVWADMQRDGRMITPSWVPFTPPEHIEDQPTALWGDVAVGSPWNLWMSFGDEAMLSEQYSQAEAWIDTGIPRNEDGLWDRTTFQFGDWLDPKAPPEDAAAATTSAYLVADAYLLQMTQLIANMSLSLGESDLAQKYTAQHEVLREKFHDAWIKEGKPLNETQTAYALCLQFNIFDDKDRDKAADAIRAIIADNDHLVGTGFAGTHILGHALHKVGATEDFYRMLLQTQSPSWLYQVVQNGTTTWERWDSLLPDGTVNTGTMTSFNHYAFGSVADWIHQVIGGLAPGSPGWKTIKIAPVPGGNIVSANAKFISGYGTITTEWSIDDKGFHLEVRVPPNSRAIVTLPNMGGTEEVGSGLHEFHDVKYHSRGRGLSGRRLGHIERH